MELQRSYQRCHLGGEGEVKTPDGKIIFHVVDISASGAAISLSGDLTEGETYDLRIRFHGSLVDFTIHAKSRVIRKERKDDRHIYGISFIGLSEKDKVEIDEIINQSCVSNKTRAMNHCDEGNCVFSHSKRQSSILAGRR